MDRTVPNGRLKALLMIDSVVGVPLDIKELRGNNPNPDRCQLNWMVFHPLSIQLYGQGSSPEMVESEDQTTNIKVKSGLGWQPRVAQAEKTVNSVFDPCNIRPHFLRSVAPRQPRNRAHEASYLLLSLF